MVELNLLVPATLVMTVLALFAQRLLMRVVVLVATGTAGPTQFGAYTVHVAAFTAHLLMGTVKRKRGTAVIKTADGPALIVMALGAIRAILPKMHIVILVATIAGCGQFRCHRIVFMAGCTGQSAMRAL